MEQDMLQGFIARLPASLAEIKILRAAQDTAALERVIHKMHGVLTYCGLPHLKSMFFQIESELHSESYINNALFDRMIEELQLLLTV